MWISATGKLRRYCGTVAGKKYRYPVKIKRENGKFGAKCWYTRNVWISVAEKLRGCCGKGTGERFYVDADQVFSGLHLLIP